MEKYLIPDQVGEGDVTEQWQRYKKEFALLLTVLGKDKAGLLSGEIGHVFASRGSEN